MPDRDPLMPISCHQTKDSSSAYVDGRLRSQERLRVDSHLVQCESCTSYFEQVNLIRSALRDLSKPAMPKTLQTNLQVIASKQKANVLKTRGSRFRALYERWKFELEQLMRPVALPATGGLLSSMLLFGFFVLLMGSTVRVTTYEVPLAADSGSAPNLVPFELRSHSVILKMSFDQSGRIADYAVADPDCKYTADLQAHPANITPPDLTTAFGGTRPFTGGIQIRFEPIAFRQ
jgi:hypothetical protein